MFACNESTFDIFDFSNLDQPHVTLHEDSGLEGTLYDPSFSTETAFAEAMAGPDMSMSMRLVSTLSTLSLHT
jgi:hypothetical protein